MSVCKANVGSAPWLFQHLKYTCELVKAHVASVSIDNSSMMVHDYYRNGNTCCSIYLLDLIDVSIHDSVSACFSWFTWFIAVIDVSVV